MMQQHERTLLKVLNASSPGKGKEKTSIKQDEKDWLEDQKIRVSELERLPEISEGNSAIKCGDWVRRIGPTIGNLSRRSGKNA